MADRAGKKPLDEIKGALSDFWNHMTAANGVQTTIGKISNPRLINPKLAEEYWREVFTPSKDATLKNYFACFLSTSIGAVSGTLFASGESVDFHSDRPVPYVSGLNEVSHSNYKVHIPWSKVEVLVEQPSPNNSSTKYLQLITVDHFHFWFMAFLSFDVALDTLAELLVAEQRRRIEMGAVGA